MSTYKKDNSFSTSIMVKIDEDKRMTISNYSIVHNVLKYGDIKIINELTHSLSYYSVKFSEFMNSESIKFNFEDIDNMKGISNKQLIKILANEYDGR